MLMKSKLEKCESKSCLLFMQRDVLPIKLKYTQAYQIEQGRRIWAFELSVTWMEPEEVITLLISVQVLNDQISFSLRI
jgi:hypothetical protein